MLKICLITTSHISSNPRLIKEAITFDQAGYEVHIIFSQNIERLARQDEILLKENSNWKASYIKLSSESFLQKLTSLAFKTFQKVIKFFNKFLSVNIAQHIEINHHFFWQLKQAKKINADLYIAHNLGALSVACLAANQLQKPCGFDAEDFHRAENNTNTYEKNRCIHLENKFIPQVTYVTAASPLIALKYENIYQIEVSPILNIFPKYPFKSEANNGSPLKLFWFSQTIGPQRGLEVCIQAINQADYALEFHLLGEISDAYKSELLAPLKNKHISIYFHASRSEFELFKLCASFDIGLASEPGLSVNNQIALSNKLFTYIQTGLVVLASDTDAQAQFLNQYNSIANLYAKQNPNELYKLITYFHENRGELNHIKLKTYELGQHQINWETEKQILIDLVKKHTRLKN